MTFPTRLLIDGEELVLDLRPHPVALLRAVLVSVAVVIAWILVLPNIGDEGFWGTVGWAAVVVGAVVIVWWPVRDAVRFLTSIFAVTSDRIIHREGLIAKRSMEIPLEAINDVRFQQNVFERMINSGDLIISSASEQGREVFKDIRNPESVQKTIYHQGELNKQRMMSGGGARAVQPAGSVADELAKLDKLRADGVISDEEFTAQKAKLLGNS
jgi:uncharacterized membrane protein YdbT with pleckstrin-like domain